MIDRSRRGAARVNIVWMVAVIVAFFVAVGFVFIASDEASKATEAKEAALLEKGEALKTAQELRETNRQLSQVLGYYDREVATARADAAQANAGLDLLKSTFADVNQSVANFEDAVGRIIPAYNGKVRDIADLRQQVAQLTTDVQNKEAAITALTTSKDRQITDLRQQLNDAEQAAAARQNELETEVASVRSTLGDTESELSRVTGSKEDVQRGWDDREVEMSTRLREMGNKLAFLREPEKPDGKLLAVSKNLDLAWINLGKNNRLFAGMTFRVVDGTPGDDRVKAWAEVINVEADMAEVVLSGQTDKFDPPTPGDLIYNPVYDPSGERHAVLVGRFSGTYNEKELAGLLADIRVMVQKSLDKTTDYLIVGSELYYDEDGEPLEEPVQPSELGVYKEAEAMGVQIVPLKQIREYFRRG